MTMCACLGPAPGEPLCRCKMRAAREYLGIHEGQCLVYSLNEEQSADFLHHMMNPKPPTASMIEAARKMKEWAESPGKLEYDSWTAAAGGKE